MSTAEDLTPLPRLWLQRVLDTGSRRALQTEYERLVVGIRAERLEPGSMEELDALVAFVELGLSLFEHMDARDLAMVPADVQGQLDGLIRGELRASETVRKLALRHLQRSIEVAARLAEILLGAGLRLPRGMYGALLGIDVDRVVAELEADPEARALVGWWMSLAVALESSGGHLDDLTHWSRRAIEGSRRIEVMLPRVHERVGAVGLRLRSRTAWSDWDEDDVAEEMEAWEELGESP